MRRCRSVQDPRPLYASLVLGLSGSIRPSKTMMLPREPGASFGEPPTPEDHRTPPSAPFLKDGTQKCASHASAALEVVPTPTASLCDSTGE